MTAAGPDRTGERLLWALLVAVGAVVAAWSGWTWLGRYRLPDLVLVSVSLDPAHDTPEVLKRYAEAYRADPARRLFLTGADLDKLNAWMQQSFLAPAARANPEAEPGQRIAHSARFFLVDQAGHLRGSYPVVTDAIDGEGNPTNTFRADPEAMDQFLDDARALTEGRGGHLPELATVEDFRLTDQDGRPVSLADLRGKVWAVSFIFTRCSMSCPKISAVQTELQDGRLALLPTVNAWLNGTSAVLLTLGYVLIRRRLVTAHVACMVGAVAVSAVFLASYLYYHFHHGATRFPGQGAVRYVYFALLLSHTILAVAVVPLVFTSLYRAVRGQWDRHARVSRWTLPLWWYVSATGVLVYLFLYRWYRA